ncbi:cactin [Diaphorina citri]|uniref:Splicing factor Cactin n=1 Tax=Diaphorina citri TaxID=121845 RepID=A0A1S3D265_DIACI|nr:cactin [Diaphorina citri]
MGRSEHSYRSSDHSSKHKESKSSSRDHHSSSDRYHQDERSKYTESSSSHRRHDALSRYDEEPSRKREEYRRHEEQKSREDKTSRASSSHQSRKKSHSSSRKHSKSSKHRHSSSSSSSSSSESSADSEKELRLLKQLAEERERKVREKKKMKELVKATETPEEKRLRRLLKKEAKERKRKEQMGWDNDYMHYTNSDNPFGDSNLLTNFVWSKKLDKEGLTGVSETELQEQNRRKMEENKRELEKVKKRRQEREAERAEREEEMALTQRGKEAAQFEEWQRQEDQFHLEQARLRSTIRIQEGRAKPIDLLAKYIGSEAEVDAVEMHEPYTYLTGLAIKDLEDLLEDIKVYMELEKGENEAYWNDISIIVEDELHGLRKLEKQGHSDLTRREGIHESVAQDVASVFKGKTTAQLEALQTQIELKISSKTENIDVGYWETLLSQLKGNFVFLNVITAEEKALQREARKGMGGDEAEFSVESLLDPQVYLWSDKYRPRKPRYFNRVHTGFEWNKYNQTHYDMDNPPPKIVQGYKFNIFYPDLIDKNSTPQYFLNTCADNQDFAILRFHAGPPYEDIAFKIVNREWEYSYKRGFRCQFHNNIFQLWFHFKRYRYRR